jgi:hypothetical protein
VAVPGDYDADGKVDFAVWRPSTGEWFTRDSSTGYTTGRTQQWGTAGDVPVPGMYDGDGQTDFATWRPSTGMWSIIDSTTGYKHGVRSGARGDVPILFYDCYRKFLVTWRPTTGFWTFTDLQGAYAGGRNWGFSGDVPVTGNFTGSSCIN